MLKTSEIMTTNVVTIGGAANVYQAVKLMQDKQLSHLIVNRRHPQDAYGMVTETDKSKGLSNYDKTLHCHQS